MNAIVERIRQDKLEPSSIEYNGSMINYEKAEELFAALPHLPGSYISVFGQDRETETIRFRNQGSGIQMAVIYDSEDKSFKTLPHPSVAYHFFNSNENKIVFTTGY